MNEQALEALKVWFAIFCAIIEKPAELSEDMDKLRKLHRRIMAEAPELFEVRKSIQ